MMYHSSMFPVESSQKKIKSIHEVKRYVFVSQSQPYTQFALIRQCLVFGHLLDFTCSTTGLISHKVYLSVKRKCRGKNKIPFSEKKLNFVKAPYPLPQKPKKIASHKTRVLGCLGDTNILQNVGCTFSFLTSVKLVLMTTPAVMKAIFFPPTF